MRTMVDLGQLPPEAGDTADFCAMVNRLFDILNSRYSTYKKGN